MLNTHIEEHSLNAWPGLQTFLLDGTVVRLADGYTKRANSATPLYDGRLSWPEKIEAIANIYRRVDLPPIIRLLTFRSEAEEVDELLAQRGYEQLDQTHVFSRPLTQETSPPSTAGCIVTSVEQFLKIYHDFHLATVNPLHGLILRQAAGQQRCLVHWLDDRPVGVGLGVVDGPALGLFDIFTRPDHRRQGIGRQIVADLLQWGAYQGATTAYLQVLSANRPALQLYESLGFVPRYEYWYRRQSK